MFEKIKAARKRSASKSELKKLLLDCDHLLGEAGESISISLAEEALRHWRKMDAESRLEFYDALATRFNPDAEKVKTIALRYADSGSAKDLVELVKTAEPPRQELFRRLNRASHGTADLVMMREEVLARLKKNPTLEAVDSDFEHLLSSWFNPGFLRLEKIDWNSPAYLLEKIIQHEAVHEIDGWNDLRRRLERDRRLFAYFHPALPGEPLIFVEVALLTEMPDAIAPLLDRKKPPDDDKKHYKVATFYSISNCQPGLKGVSLGNFLIKRVAEKLKQEFPGLKTFCTLSPIPSFGAFINGSAPLNRDVFTPRQYVDLQDLREHLGQEIAKLSGPPDEQLSKRLARLCAGYLLQTAPRDEQASDPVARFHLNNGARLERINLMADQSSKGVRQSFGLMVNYAYDLDEVEDNHEKFVAGRVTASRAVRGLLD